MTTINPKLPYWHHQLPFIELVSASARVTSAKSQPKVLEVFRETGSPGSIDRTPETPGSGKKTRKMFRFPQETTMCVSCVRWNLVMTQLRLSVLEIIHTLLLTKVILFPSFKCFGQSIITRCTSGQQPACQIFHTLETIILCHSMTWSMICL